MCVKRIILGSVLIFVLLVSSYLTVVPILELFTEKTLVRSVVLQGYEGSSSFVMLRMSDVLTMVAEVDSASNAYLLEVQDGVGKVFSRWDRINGSHVEIGIPLCLSSFEVGKSYVLFFHVYALNYPLPGATISDTRMVGFTVEASETRLDFEVSYDGIFRCLSLWANLTNVDGYPVVDETVGFYMRPVSGRSRLTDGWIPIGSAKTDEDGTTSFCQAFKVPDGNYMFRAYHAGDENFGESENVTAVEIASETAEGLCFGYEPSIGKAVSHCSDGDLTISVSSDNPYALLQMNASAEYVVDEPLQGTYTFILFFCDYMSSAGFLGGVSASVSEGPPYVYNGSFGWCPEAVGYHELIVGIANGTMFDIIDGTHGVGLRAWEAVDLEVQGCPSNLVVHYPQVVYDDVLSITAAFSMPRVYSASSTDFYVAGTLAPELTYNEVDYVIDEPVDSVPVELYADGDLVSVNQTDEDGLAFFSLDLNFSDAHFTSNITAVVDDAVLFESLAVEQVVSFTRVGVSDVSSKGSDSFQLNYTLNGLDSPDEVYVGTDNLLKADLSLFNQSVWNVPVSVISAKFVSSCKTQMEPLRVGSVPTGSDYLRVTYFYNNTALVGDVFHDGQVDLFDAVAVCTAYGSHPGDSNWNPDADVAPPWESIDLYDSVTVLNYYGQSGVYYSPEVGLYVLFDNGQRVDVDSSGCVRIPSGASSFNVCRNGENVGAFVEFFEITSDEVCWTNNIGTIATVWKPMEMGTYLLQVKLPSCFNATTTFWSDVTEVDAYLSIVDYYIVEKRPIELSVNFVPEEPTFDDEVTIIANVFDVGLEEPAENLEVCFGLYGVTLGGVKKFIVIGCGYTNSSGVATISFAPIDYYKNSSLFMRFYVVVGCLNTSCTEYSETYVLLDTRYPTRLELLGEEVIHAGVGDKLFLDFSLVRADNGDPLVGRPVNMYMNDTWKNCTATDENGTCTFEVDVGKGMCFFRAWFHYSEECAGAEGLDVNYTDSNNVTFVIYAEAEPIFMFFDVQPNDPTLGSPATLSATVYDAMSNEPKSDCLVWFYWCADNGTCDTVGSDYTNGDGVASVSWIYRDDGRTYVFWARVHDKQQIVSSPVMLTVGEATALSMSVEADEGFDYNFSGTLLCNGNPLDQEPIEVKANGTSLGYVKTRSDGSYSFLVTLPPADNMPTDYQVELVYHGSDSLNLNGLATTPDGTEYAVCTTLQYFPYKPASNCIMLTVKPQSTEIVKSTETPEEIQAEAEQNGWLSVYNEWSWWYPWYRLHFNFTMNNAKIDVGFNPVLSGGETIEYSALESAFPQITAESGLTLEEIAQIAEEAVVEAAIGTLTASVAAIAVANIRVLPSTAIALAVYIGGLSLMIGYAWSLYSSGAQIKAKAFLVGLVVDLWGVALATFMSIRGALLTEMIVTVVASAFSSLFDPSSLQVAVMSAIAALLTSVCVGIATLILVPEPSSITFKLVFPWFSLLFAAIALNIVGSWS
jgi:hypothetical protein